MVTLAQAEVTMLFDAKSTSTSASIDAAHTIPASWYRDPAIAEWESEAIFGYEWQYLMPAGRVESPGQYSPDSIGALPVLAVHGHDGQIRVFHNVCRHRAGPIATTDGRGRTLQCRYHGWSYSTDGKLLGMPGVASEDALKGFAKQNCRLPEVASVVWAGMIFVNLSAKPGDENCLKFLAMLQKIGSQCGVQNPAELPFRFVGRQVFRVACNWKTYVDNYLEGYHVAMVHPGLARVLDTTQYTTTVFDGYTLQYSPLADNQSIYQKGAAFYFHLFPNVMFNILPQRLQTNVVKPVDTGHCDVIFDYFYTEIDSVDAKARIAEDFRFSDEVQKEDMTICESVQLGLNSGSYDVGRYVPQHEQALFSFHQYLRMRSQKVLS